MSLTASQHNQKVKAFFEMPRGYFDRRGFDIRIRSETVEAFTRGRHFKDALDIGCGNGQISLPLLEHGRCGRLTLVDVSQTMLDLAKARIRDQHADRVTCVNEDLMSIAFGSRRFDLVVCVGVLAHVADPELFMTRVASLLVPGGVLIMEITDGFHAVGRLLRLYHAALGWFRPTAYDLNRLRTSTVLKRCADEGLELVTIYRYCLPPPGSQRLFSHESLYRTIKRIFGDAHGNRLGWLGNVALGAWCKP